MATIDTTQHFNEQEKNPNRTHQITAIKSTHEIKEGCYYAILHRSKGFTVVKTLVKDNFGVHITMFSNIFDNIPYNLKPSKLFIASPNETSDSAALGIESIPVSFNSLKTWQLIDIGLCEAVSKDELEGYEMWKEANGGYF